MPAPLISLALHRSCPLVRRQMAGMVPSDLLTKRVSSPAPRGLLTSFFQTRSLDALAPGAPPGLVRRRAGRRAASPLLSRPFGPALRLENPIQPRRPARSPQPQAYPLSMHTRSPHLW